MTEDSKRESRAMLDKGIELLRESDGSGRVAGRGDRVVYNVRFFLRRGDEVRMDAKSIELYRSSHRIREVEGVELIDHSTILGKRRPIAAVEKTLEGMAAGGFREVEASPHLCYGDRGIPDFVPANAMLRIQIWLREVSDEFE